MTLLRRLKIGRRCYDVRHRDLGPDLYGQIHLARRKLDIADDLTANEVVYALIHEVLHGIWEQAKLPERPTEERAVTSLAWGLTAVLRDNPGLAIYIEDHL